MKSTMHFMLVIVVNLSFALFALHGPSGQGLTTPVHGQCVRS